jgi:hypothetical protein
VVPNVARPRSDSAAPSLGRACLRDIPTNSPSNTSSHPNYQEYTLNDIAPFQAGAFNMAPVRTCALATSFTALLLLFTIITILRIITIYFSSRVFPLHYFSPQRCCERSRETNGDSESSTDSSKPYYTSMKMSYPHEPSCDQGRILAHKSLLGSFQLIQSRRKTRESCAIPRREAAHQKILLYHFSFRNRSKSVSESRIVTASLDDLPL